MAGTILVVVVSATASKESTAGAVDFIKKPVDLDILLQMVEN
jgi:FixJ family two-component response regulator